MHNFPFIHNIIDLKTNGHFVHDVFHSCVSGLFMNSGLYMKPQLPNQYIKLALYLQELSNVMRTNECYKKLCNFHVLQS